MNGLDGLIVEQYSTERDDHVAFAEQLDAMRIAESPAMLPIDPATLASHALGVVAHRDGTPIGYNGIIFQYDNNVGEMGGLFINPDFRGNGLTRPIKAELFDLVRGTSFDRLVTFANENSLGLNLDLGFRVASRSEIPGQGLANCTKCPRFATKEAARLCCDTVLTIDVADLPHIRTSSVK